MSGNHIESFEEAEGRALVLSPRESFEGSEHESRYTTPMLDTDDILNDQVLIQEDSSDGSDSEDDSSSEEESSDEGEEEEGEQEEEEESSVSVEVKLENDESNLEDFITTENNVYTFEEELENDDIFEREIEEELERETYREEENEEEYELLENDSPTEGLDSNTELNNSGQEFDDIQKAIPIEYLNSKPADESFHNLKSFTLKATNEDRQKRNEKLLKTGTFFTKEAYKAFSLTKPDPYQSQIDRLIENMRKKRSREMCDYDENDEINIEDPEDTDMNITSTDNSNLMDTDQIEIDSISKQVSKTNMPVMENTTTITETPLRKKAKVQATTVLDTVLTDMLRYNRSQVTTQEPSDLEIAAMAAGLDFSSQSTSQQYSKFTRDQHNKFLQISEQMKSGFNSVSEADVEIYKRMCTELKQEQNNFIKEQRKKVYDSGVYDLLDEKIEKMVQEYHEIENMRLSQYPQFYKYFNLLQMPIPNSSTDSPILTFKQSLLQTGTIAPCKSSAMETPRRLDLFKNYIKTPSTDNEEETYYKSKLPVTVSMDENIKQLIETNETDIVISLECLLSLIELVHDISLDMHIPIKVVVKDNKKTLIFDRPLPKEEMTAREKNKLIYDVAFKSLCLDWPNRRGVSSVTEENSNKEENLQYNMWKFGDINIMIRHQIDGELIDYTNKKPGSKDRRVYLTSKLDYQINEEREEITTANERSTNWLKSYIGGHAAVIEGRIDVVKNRLVRVDVKEMVDIMGSQWRPMLESELLRHIFSQLRKMLLEPGNYMLNHKKDDRNFIIYQGTEEICKDLDLSLKRKSPTLIKSDKSFIPAWSPTENRIPWTFPPK